VTSRMLYWWNLSSEEADVRCGLTSILFEVTAAPVWLGRFSESRYLFVNGDVSRSETSETESEATSSSKFSKNLE
jgi:hypothetical protein